VKAVLWAVETQNFAPLQLRRHIMAVLQERAFLQTDFKTDHKVLEKIPEKWLIHTLNHSGNLEYVE